MATQTTGHFACTGWQETSAGRAEGGAGLARAEVVNDYTGGVTARGTVCRYLISYLPDSTAVCVGHELVTGTLDGRPGSFVLEHRCAVDAGGTVRCDVTVVPGSGGGELAGLTGGGAYTALPGTRTTPYTFDYALP